MLEELLKSGKITIDDVEVYQLFRSELGDRWLRKKMLETFLDQPPPHEMTPTNITFIDGRRALIREIHYSLETITNLIREYEHDNRPREQQPG